ncbi:hypothetical protein GGI17_001307 [Coemansia sp. S146]|nr:hypothetical protein GGI17_001307 [Coemansia sp. S146]
MLAMIGTRLALCVLLLASIAMSASSTDSEWLPSILFVGQTSSNGQSATPTTIQALPAPRPVFTTTMIQTQTDTKVIISAATIPTAEGTLTHPFSSSSTSSLSHPFSSSSSMTHPFSSSSHSSAAVELPVNLLSATFVVVVVGSVLAALF